MAGKIFLYHAVKDIDKSKEFFKSLGHSFNEQFCDKSSACLALSENIDVMLLTEEKIKEIMPPDVVDTVKTAKMVTSISLDSKELVNGIVEKAKKAGAPVVRDPEDHGFMLHRSFNDIDGHVWNYMWMDSAAMVNN